MHIGVKTVLSHLTQSALNHYGENLTTLAIYGSLARDRMRPDSDIDLLVVCRHLPEGRMARVNDFEAVEAALSPDFQKLKGEGIFTYLSAIFKTEGEVEYGSPLFLDMTEDVLLLLDRRDFFQNYLNRLKKRMEALGSKKVFSHGGYYWVLKPDLKPGEVIEL
jgi:hypothetical protein